MLWRVRFDCQSLLRGHWLRPAALRPQQRLVRECRRGGRGAKVQGECLGCTGTSFPPHTSWWPSSNCLLAQQPSGPVGLGCAHLSLAGPVWLRPSTVPLRPPPCSTAGLLCVPCRLVSLVGWMGSSFPSSSRRSQQGCLGSQPAVWHVGGSCASGDLHTLPTTQTSGFARVQLSRAPLNASLCLSPGAEQAADGPRLLLPAPLGQPHVPLAGRAARPRHLLLLPAHRWWAQPEVEERALGPALLLGLPLLPCARGDGEMRAPSPAGAWGRCPVPAPLAGAPAGEPPPLGAPLGAPHWAAPQGGRDRAFRPRAHPREGSRPPRDPTREGSGPPGAVRPARTRGRPAPAVTRRVPAPQPKPGLRGAPGPGGGGQGAAVGLWGLGGGGLQWGAAACLSPSGGTPFCFWFHLLGEVSPLPPAAVGHLESWFFPRPCLFPG